VEGLSSEVLIGMLLVFLIPGCQGSAYEACEYESSG
jgi:hypothetical protein